MNQKKKRYNLSFQDRHIPEAGKSHLVKEDMGGGRQTCLERETQTKTLKAKNQKTINSDNLRVFFFIETQNSSCVTTKL